MVDMNIDEAKLSPEERLGLAYCRLNSYEWDAMFGEMPLGYDEMDRGKKYENIRTLFNAVENTLGAERASMYWWMFKLNKTEQEWRGWYFKDRIRHFVS